VTFGPSVRPGRRIDELRVDAHAIAPAANTAFQYVAHTELPADLSHVRRTALIAKTGVSRDDEQILKSRQLRRNVFHDAVCEILLLRVSTHVGEGQDCDRRALGPGQ